MRTYVRVVRGPYSGRTGWIAGVLEDRSSEGITKSVVHFADICEPLLTADLELFLQLDLPLPAPQTKTPPARGQRRNYSNW